MTDLKSLASLYPAFVGFYFDTEEDFLCSNGLNKGKKRGGISQ